VIKFSGLIITEIGSPSRPFLILIPAASSGVLNLSSLWSQLQVWRSPRLFSLLTQLTSFGVSKLPSDWIICWRTVRAHRIQYKTSQGKKCLGHSSSRPGGFFFFFVTLNWTQDLTHARQVLYHLRYTLSVGIYSYSFLNNVDTFFHFSVWVVESNVFLIIEKIWGLGM
jgi:hypothetical protein